jgi:GMP synthase (glutamine-hydrolysing)
MVTGICGSPGGLKSPACMRILVIQHDADKGLGLFERPLEDASLALDVRFAGQEEVEPADHAAVIALPGVANPDENSLAVTATRAALQEALRRGVPALGICLGAELLAQAAGATSSPCPVEWG